MIIVVCFLLVVASVPLCGGRLSCLGEMRFTMGWTVAASLVLQMIVIGILDGAIPQTLSAAGHLLSYGLIIVFVWANRRVGGLNVLVLGGMLNLVAISANGGIMPMSPQALETAGIPLDSDRFQNSAPVEDPAFWYLGDVFAIPDGYPFANVFSVGDVILVIGAGIFLHSTSQSRLARRRPDDLDVAPGLESITT